MSVETGANAGGGASGDLELRSAPTSGGGGASGGLALASGDAAGPRQAATYSLPPLLSPRALTFSFH